LPPLYPVKGKVTLDGAAYKGGGTVQLVKAKAAKDEKVYRIIGEIDAEGNYELSTEGKAGAPEGQYKAIVSPNMASPMEAEKGPPKMPFDAKKYSNANSTPLFVTVSSGADPAAYHLKLKGSKK
jgi:hypothetical protein